jgi:hypothetical protein
MNIKSLKAHAQKLKIHTLTVYFAARDPNMPVFVRLLAIIVAAYALSPIDLISTSSQSKYSLRGFSSALSVIWLQLNTGLACLVINGCVFRIF